MKTTLILTSLILTLSSVAFADDTSDAFRNAGVSARCANVIFAAAKKQCDTDSLRAEGSDRMNPCVEMEADTASGGQYNGKLEVTGYAGDADGYTYAVTILNARQCKYSFTAEQ